jgi:hypothetical protein
MDAFELSEKILKLDINVVTLYLVLFQLVAMGKDGIYSKIWGGILR